MQQQEGMKGKWMQVSLLAENCQFHAPAALSRKDVVSRKDFSSLELFRLFSKTKAMI